MKQSRIDDVSANVVSALQGGAFFGALSSAPVSGGSRIPPSAVQTLFSIVVKMQAFFRRAAFSAGAGEFLTNDDSPL